MTTTLYCLSSKNNILTWTATVDDCTVRIQWGDGPNQYRNELYPSPEEAITAYTAEVKYQIDRKGYRKSIPTKRPMMPMLAQEYDWDKVLGPFAMQPKFDGIRCLASKTQLISRKNEQFKCFPHLEAILRQLPDDITLDGELYIHNLPFDLISGYARRNTVSPMSSQFRFIVYDIIDTEKTFVHRYNELINIISGLVQSHSVLLEMKQRSQPFPFNRHLTKQFPIDLCPTEFFDKAPSEHRPSVKAYFDNCISQKYEGAIVRTLDKPYELNFRSPSLLKMKSFDDSEFLIVGVETDRDGCGILTCEYNSTTFQCQMNWEKWRQVQIAQNPDHFIGKLVQVKYQGYTVNGMPRAPKGLRIIKQGDKI
jgi:hypothetical protein